MWHDSSTKILCIVAIWITITHMGSVYCDSQLQTPSVYNETLQPSEFMLLEHPPDSANQTTNDDCEKTRLPPSTWPSNTTTMGIPLHTFISEGLLNLNLNSESTRGTLILRQIGIDRTTITKPIAGNSSLHSLLTSDDDNLIGKPSESNSLVPEMFVGLNSSSIFYDCPGFSDNRDPVSDIAANFFTKKVTDHLSHIKILVLVSSTSFNDNNTDFDNLATHMTKFVGNITKYSSGMALIATNVENYDSGNNSRSDLSMVDGIVEFLNDYVFTLENKLNTTTDENDRNILENKIEFTNSFLEKDSNGNHSKIGFISAPQLCGKFSIPALLGTQSQLISLQNQLSYVEINATDLVYSLQADTVLKIQNFGSEINHEVANIFQGVLDKYEKYYKSLLSGFSNDYLLITETLEWSLETFVPLLHKIQTEPNFTLVVREFEIFFQNLNYPIENDVLQRLKNESELLEFFHQVEKGFSAGNEKWAEPFQRLMENLNVEIKWLEYIQQLKEKVESYSWQKSKNSNWGKRFTDVGSALSFANSYVEPVPRHISYMKDMDNYNGYRRNSYGFLDILTSAFDSTEIQCIQGGTELVVKGSFVLFSEFIREGKILFYNCRYASVITVFASKILYLDRDINGRGEELRIYLFSPVWEVVDSVLIDLNGIDAKQYSRRKAANGNSPGANGQSGEPGLPGVNGGGIYGVGVEIKGGQLTVEIKCGNGGNGQDGGDGMKGSDGTDMTLDKLPSCYKDLWETEAFMFTKKTVTPGTKGSPGGNGGNGGMKGKGADFCYASFVYEEDHDTIEIVWEEGLDGVNGQGGKGAPGGKDGNNLEAILVVMMGVCNYQNPSIKYVNKQGRFGKNGISGGNTIGRQLPLQWAYEKSKLKSNIVSEFRQFMLDKEGPVNSFPVLQVLDENPQIQDEIISN